MIPTYRTHLHLAARDANDPVQIESVLPLLRAWLQRFVSDDLTFDEGVHSSGDVELQVIRDDDDPARISIRLRRFVERQQARWITEVSLAEGQDGLTASVQVGVERQRTARLSANLRASPPAIVRRLVETFTCRAGLEVANTPITISTKEDVGHLLELMASDDRVLPIVCVSVDSYSERPLLSLDDLQKGLLGLAHIVRINKRASFELSERLADLTDDEELGQRWSVFGGAVRVYWPRADPTLPDSNPFAHRLWLPREVNSELPEAIRRYVAFDANQREIGDWLSGNQLLMERSRRTAARAAAEADSGDLAAVREMLAEVEEKENLLAETIATLTEQRDEANAEVQRLQSENEGLKYSLRSVQDARAGAGGGGAGGQRFRTLGDALDQARSDFEDTLLIPRSIDTDTDESADFWYDVLLALHELCLGERNGLGMGKREALALLLRVHIARNAENRKRQDTGVYAKHPETDARVHLRERVHIQEGKPDETESAYWERVGDAGDCRYLVGRLGRHP